MAAGMASSRFILAPYYAVRPRLWRENLRAIDPRSFVSHRWSYVFLRVPKAANSTVLRTLIDRFPEPDLPAGDLEEAKIRATHFRDLGFGDLARVRRYFAFTVVRNPYTRALSAFLDKFREGDKHRAKFGDRVAGYDAGRLSFRGFCRYLADGGEAENGHWMRQTRLVSIVERLDFVGRIETLETDMARIVEHIAGGDGTISLTRAGPPATGALGRVGEHLDAECRRLIEIVYAADFERFGYRPGDV